MNHPEKRKEKIPSIYCIELDGCDGMPQWAHNRLLDWIVLPRSEWAQARSYVPYGWFGVDDAGKIIDQPNLTA